VRLKTIGAIFAFSAVALTADPPVPEVLKDIERRYNGAKTLRVNFAEVYSRGSDHRTEAGQLLLRKPGRMRWIYSDPVGKLFVSDGKNVFLYSPHTQRVEKMKLKETEDMRAPMAFLLGRLDFSRDFRDFQISKEAGVSTVVAVPKKDNMPYTQVTFVVGPMSDIRRLTVTGQDKSVLRFDFSNEVLNPPLDDKIFRYQPPAGVQVVDSTIQDQ
jgi:outer membrane lipoprotein carrier protein